MLSSLFTPVTIKSLTLKNRFVMSPMTRYYSPGGIPTPDVAEYYARRAASDVALILTEGAAVNRPAAVESPNVPRFYGSDALEAWKAVFSSVHEAGGKIAPQLWHVGAWFEQSGWTPPTPFEGPSGLKEAGNMTGIAMTEEDIADTIRAFANAAIASKEAGADCVEIHGAHGYLVDQFYWDETNTRTDRWGGSTLAERGRFAVALVKAVRAAVGEDFPIFFRISQWKIQAYQLQMAASPDELGSWVGPLADAGVDLFDCSQRRFWDAEFEGDDLNLAGWVKKLTGRPTMTVGSVGLSRDMMSSFDGGEATKPGSLDELVRRYERGDFDLVAVGRALLSDPRWLTKVREGRNDELRNFDVSHVGTLF